MKLIYFILSHLYRISYNFLYIEIKLKSTENNETFFKKTNKQDIHSILDYPILFFQKWDDFYHFLDLKSELNKNNPLAYT